MGREGRDYLSRRHVADQDRFDMISEANGIEHRLTKPNLPWTTGQVERMSSSIKDATVKRFHYDDHDQLRTYIADFIAAYNFARRLKALGGLTSYEDICKIWTSEPDRFILNPIYQMPGINTKVSGGDVVMKITFSYPAIEPRPDSPMSWQTTQMTERLINRLAKMSKQP